MCYSGGHKIILEVKGRPVKCEHLSETKLDQCFLNWLEVRVGFHRESHTCNRTRQADRLLVCSAPSRCPALHWHWHQTQSRRCSCHSTFPPQLPCPPLVLTTKSADFPDTLQGSRPQGGGWERIFFRRTPRKSEELLYNKSTQHLFSFNRHDKVYSKHFYYTAALQFYVVMKNTECWQMHL